MSERLRRGKEMPLLPGGVDGDRFLPQRRGVVIRRRFSDTAGNQL